MTAMRVCFVTTFYPPFNFGGDGIAVQRLARGLAKWGCEVTVIHDADAYAALTTDPAPAPEAAEPVGIRVIALRSRWPLASALLTHQLGRPIVNSSRLRRLLDHGRFDAIMFNNVSLVGGPAILGYGGAAAKLYLAHEHWLVCPTHVLWRHHRELCDRRECIRCQIRYRRPPQWWRYTGMLDRALANVDVFIALSEFSRAKHREFGFPREMKVVPNFLPDPAPGADGRSEVVPRPHERPYFLFVGRLEQFKGLDEVIDLFATFDAADLVVIGDGTYAAALHRRASRNPRIRFLGRLPGQVLEPYYRHAVALIAPSICFESFGMTLIEAFSHGTPVLARRLGSFPEIIERSGGGILFDSTEGLLHEMQALLGAPDRRTVLGQKGYNAYVQHWSESAVVPQYLSILEETRWRRSTKQSSCARS
ncbi:MAG TPA: glycosyltransferase family 4 protein [Vicinamibacterales bacterium]|nr:glycosyltransferase family 4 protein [Vicinamibacterales bacterium]